MLFFEYFVVENVSSSQHQISGDKQPWSSADFNPLKCISLPDDRHLPLVEYVLHLLFFNLTEFTTVLWSFVEVNLEIFLVVFVGWYVVVIFLGWYVISHDCIVIKLYKMRFNLNINSV